VDESKIFFRGDNMKEIYIMLSQLGTLVSKSIRLYTGAKYNHASISIDPEIREFYSFARRVRYFPLIAGFIREVLNEGMFKYYPDTECVIYALPVEDEVYRNTVRLLDRYRKDAMKYKYNFLGFFGVVLNKAFVVENRHTCSEFVANVLHEAGIYTFPKPLPLVRPDDIPGIPGLRKLFEGRMTDFTPECRSDAMSLQA